MNTDLCTEAACNQAASVSLSGDSLCKFHFIARSYRWLEECNERIRKREHVNDLVSERIRRLLREIARGAVTVAFGDIDVNAMDQAQIMELLAAVTDLADSLPRAPAKTVSSFE
jgi:hypothetical protein